MVSTTSQAATRSTFVWRVTVNVFDCDGKGDDCQISALLKMGCCTTPGHLVLSVLFIDMLVIIRPDPETRIVGGTATETAARGSTTWNENVNVWLGCQTAWRKPRTSVPVVLVSTYEVFMKVDVSETFKMEGHWAIESPAIVICPVHHGHTSMSVEILTLMEFQRHGLEDDCPMNDMTNPCLMNIGALLPVACSIAEAGIGIPKAAILMALLGLWGELGLYRRKLKRNLKYES
jgi:hypothetical protein